MKKFLSDYIGDRKKRLGPRKSITVAFDVDMTLIDHEDKPIYQNIQLLLWFIDRGHDVIIWSGGGVDWAESCVRKLGLEGVVRVIFKGTEYVDIAFDDQAINLGKVNVEV